MNIYNLNDYELIYLIRDYNEIALNLLLKKYMPYIRAKIYDYNVSHKCQDDFFQECLMTLHDAIYSFNEYKGASFYTYMNVIISRKIIRLYKASNIPEFPDGNLELKVYDNTSLYGNNYFDEGLKLFSDDIDRIIYYETYHYGLAPRMISLKYNIDIKVIYNKIQKIKKVLRQLNID